MKLLDRFLADQLKDLLKRKIRPRVVGRYQELPAHIQQRLRHAEAQTAEFSEYTLALALNYGSRTELVDAFKAAAADAQSGKLDPGLTRLRRLSSLLIHSRLPDPDLVIRTSGESRLSNFLLLQAAYAEIYITDVLWPDFDQKQFKLALENYAARERRYGKTGEQIRQS